MHARSRSCSCHANPCMRAQVADLKALRDLLLFHADDIEDIMSALKAHQDFSACALARFISAL